MTQIDDHPVTNAELAAQDPTGRLYNHDLAPATKGQRTWNVYHLFSLWMNDAHNAGNYTWAAGLFVGLGMSAFDITVGIFAGCLVILGGCVLSGFMGQATGTPYPVISRITWGVWGANIPALVRGVVAIAWYGVQTYLASLALNSILSRAVPGFRDLSLETAPHFLGLSLGGWICFLVLSVLQLLIVQKGMEVIRHVQGWGGPIIWVVMLGLMFYFLSQADWSFDWFTSWNGEAQSGGTRMHFILIAMAQTVGTLATLMLNFSDFTRFSKDRRSVVIGNIIGLPLNWTAFAVTSVITTAAAAQVLTADINDIKDPGILIEHVDNSVMFYVFSIGFVFATLGVNIVANFVSASFDLSNVNPRRISFRAGGIITAVVAVLVTPWNYFNNAIVVGYFLGSLGALLGPFFGILVVDFYLVRKQRFSIRHMYLPTQESIYYYNKGVSRLALYALIPAAVIALSVALVPWFSVIKDFGWFIGAPIAGIIYYLVANNRVIVLPADEVRAEVTPAP